MNSFSGLSAWLLLCALRTAWPAKLACPETVLRGLAATAGSCLTPKFVYSDNNSTIARRHQGISMFGETEAFNLNSHVYNENASGVYVTIRYSTAKKAAADIPAVVGSMFATGALYALTAFSGAGLGVGGTILVLKTKKKKEELPTEVSE